MGMLKIPVREIAAQADRWSGAILLALLLVVCWSLVDVWKEFLGLRAWRHDALFYLASYSEKLQTEGRWINFISFDLLRRSDPMFSAMLHAFFLGWFAAFCATRISGDRLYGALIGLLTATSVPLYIQLLWPLTSLPAFFILASTPLLFPYLNRFIFFGLYGLLLFGSLSSLYFLLPLLFIPWAATIDGSLSLRAWTITRKLVLPWVVGYLVGFIVATIATGLISGQWSIEIAQWRRGNFASDTENLIINLITAARYLLDHVAYHLDYTGWPINIAALLVFIAACRSRRHTLHLLIPIMVILSLYASIIPYSVALSYRTAVVLSIGMVFLFLVPTTLTRAERLPFGAVVTVLAIAQSSAVTGDLNWFRTSSNLYRTELQQVAQRPLDQYKGILMLSDRREMQLAERRINSLKEVSHGPGIKTLGDHRRWRALVLDLGAPRVLLCASDTPPKPCTSLPLSEDTTWLASPSGLYSATAHTSGWLIVRIQD